MGGVGMLVASFKEANWCIQASKPIAGAHALRRDVKLKHLAGVMDVDMDTNANMWTSHMDSLGH